MTGGTMELLDRAKIVDVKAKKGRWMRERVSDAYGRKYRRSRGSLASMQRPEVLATTLRLEVIR
ncbi:MAG: hypothetical protein ACR2G8_03510 [Candidatus Limnocylindria bacterium]